MSRTPVPKRHNLRLRVFLHGVLVDDRLVRRPYSPRPLRGVLEDHVPYAGDATVHFVRAERSEIHEDGAVHVLEGEEGYRTRAGECEVLLTLAPQYRLTPRELAVDLWLPLLVLVAMVFGAVLSGQGADQTALLVSPEPSPELIARLLNNEIAGAREGLLARMESRPTNGAARDDVWMPSGSKGPLDKPGGAEDPAELLRKQLKEQKKPRIQPLRPKPPVLPTPVEAPPAVEGVVEPRKLGETSPDGDDEADEVAEAPSSTERGFGLEDWYDTRDARRDDKAVQERLNRAEELAELDPDASWALLQLAYYQYLSRDYEACRRTYDRFIELFPDDATGYNNVALVYKRLGEYKKEEGYYRLALALEPEDENVLNNLAVNLAHQGRFSEALAIMDELGARNPKDPYADLHRAKIYAAMGDEEKALFFLEKSLAGLDDLDTFHNIEFRQDIRLDPAFANLRLQSRFHELLARYYGEEAGSGNGGDHG